MFAIAQFLSDSRGEGPRRSHVRDRGSRNDHLKLGLQRTGVPGSPSLEPCDGPFVQISDHCLFHGLQKDIVIASSNAPSAPTAAAARAHSAAPPHSPPP